MNRFDDLLPEEIEPQHEELITLLKRSYRKPVPLLPMKEAQVVERVRERLMQSGFEDVTTEDIPVPQRGVLDSTPHKSVSPVGILRRDKRRLRLIALLAATLVIAALLVTPLLLLRSSLNGGTDRVGLPTLTLSSNAAKVNDTVTLTFAHFSHSATVALTHDVQEPISINGHSTIATDDNGTASVQVVINTSWGPGFHLIVAEDVATRNTASATLQITGHSPTPPPHLLIDTTPIDLGADVVGANSIRTFKLANSGGGSITWSASSDQPWLLISPSQGIFSQEQPVSLAVQRVGLKPKDYSGHITITTNVSVAQRLEVDMKVLPLPPNAGPVVALSPALLSFIAYDGEQNNSPQTLTISNPGSHQLGWSLTSAQGSTCNWLSATPASGNVAPGASSVLRVTVRSQCLLPGAFIGTLKFTGNGAIDGSQTVNVSLTIQPHCGLVTSTGSLAFTVVQGQNTLANQTVSLNATASCAGTPLPWTSTSTAPWLSLTPGSGQLQGTASAAVSVSVNAANLLPNRYYGNLALVTGQSTLTITVQLMVQAPPSSTAPIIVASPLSLNFSNTQGQPNPTGKVVTITNNGTSPLKWNASTMQWLFIWLGAAPSGGTILPGQTGQVTINVDTKQLTPGSYVGQVTLNGMDAKGNQAPGSPQTITITLVVQPPCAISPPSASSLSFSAVQGASSNPPAQTVMFTGTGNCVWPVTWKLSSTVPWLTPTSATGTIKGTGQSGSIDMGANIAGLPVGTYSTQVSILASDASGAAVQGSPLSLMATLTVTGYTVSGTAFACPGSTPPTCTAPQALPGATVTVLSGSSTVATTTADASGNYTFSMVTLGSYTITVAGFDASNNHYVGSLALTLTGNALNLTVQAFPG